MLHELGFGGRVYSPKRALSRLLLRPRDFDEVAVKREVVSDRVLWATERDICGSQAPEADQVTGTWLQVTTVSEEHTGHRAVSAIRTPHSRTRDYSLWKNDEVCRSTREWRREEAGGHEFKVSLGYTMSP